MIKSPSYCYLTIMFKQIRCGVSASIGADGMLTPMDRSAQFYAGIKVLFLFVFSLFCCLFLIKATLSSYVVLFRLNIFVCMIFN
jgi:hypothetical protein